MDQERHYIYFLNGPPPTSFILIPDNLTENIVDLSGIQTQIVGVVGKHADHLTITTPAAFIL